MTNLQDHNMKRLSLNTSFQLPFYLHSYLLEYGLPLLGVSDGGQLHVSHLLHLLVHVDLLLQLADLGSQQSHRILPVVLPSQSGGTCRVDCRDPVLQFRLA